MNTLTKTLVIISIILLGCIELMAQKDLLLQDIPPLMSFSSESRSNIILSADYNSNSFNFYLEEKIQVSDWMLYNKEWLSNSDLILANASRLETEEEIIVEDWMIRDFKIENNWLSKLTKEDEETPLMLQDWMLCCKEWQAVNL